jgi:hypothetical protein
VFERLIDNFASAGLLMAGWAAQQRQFANQKGSSNFSSVESWHRSATHRSGWFANEDLDETGNWIPGCFNDTFQLEGSQFHNSAGQSIDVQ